MAQKKAGGSSRNGRDSPGQRLGIKLSDGQITKPGGIIARQNGFKWHPGSNVGVGNDYTIYAPHAGTVKYHKKRVNGIYKTFISLIPFPLH